MGEPKKDSLVDRLKSITGTAFDQGTVGSAGGSNPSPQ
jgi:Lon-like ATP-dependent protease